MGVNKINDEFSLVSGLHKVKKVNNSEGNLDDFLNDLFGETSAALPSGDGFKLDLQINQKYSEDELIKHEFKKDLIRESAKLNLNLPEQKMFNEVLNQGLELAEELLNMKKEGSLELDSFSKKIKLNEFDLELIQNSNVENPIIEEAFIGLYKDIIDKDGELPEKLNKILIEELETINEKVETDLEENLYLIILDYAKSDPSFSSDLNKSYTEMRLEVHDNMNLEIDENGTEILSELDQHKFNLIDKAEEQELDPKELNLFSKLLDKEDILLAETLVDLKSFDLINNQSLGIIERASKVAFLPDEKEEFTAYLLVEENGLNFAEAFLDLKESDKLSEESRESMYQSLGLHLFSDELKIDIDDNELKNMSLIEKGLKGLLKGDETRQLIEIVGKFNLLKFGLESHLTFEDYENFYGSKEKPQPLEQLLPIKNQIIPLPKNSKEFTSLQDLMDKGLKGELKSDEILLFIEMVGKDNLLKFGLESYGRYIRDR